MAKQLALATSSFFSNIFLQSESICELRLHRSSSTASDPGFSSSAFTTAALHVPPLLASQSCLEMVPEQLCLPSVLRHMTHGICSHILVSKVDWSAAGGLASLWSRMSSSVLMVLLWSVEEALTSISGARK